MKPIGYSTCPTDVKIFEVQKLLEPILQIDCQLVKLHLVYLLIGLRIEAMGKIKEREVLKTMIIRFNF